MELGPLHIAVAIQEGEDDLFGCLVVLIHIAYWYLHKRLEGLEHHHLPTSISPGALSSTQADGLHTEGLRVTVWFQGSAGHGLIAPA